MHYHNIAVIPTRHIAKLGYIALGHISSYGSKWNKKPLWEK